MSQQFRGDVEGLRAVAILLVILFHANVAGFGAGFVGVDVFFVLSGYLITGNIVGEIERNGRIDLVGFWARRIRRLVPAAALVFAVSTPIALAYASPLEWGRVALDARAALAYISNIRFARKAEDYFATGSEESFFLHSWSLSVEEQFYVFWPIMLLVAVVAARWVKRPFRSVATIVVAFCALASFVVAFELVRRGSSWGFYSSPTRAWQFALGALVVFTGKRPHGRVASFLSVVGACTIAVSLFVVDGRKPYPGLMAVLPTLGAACLLYSGELGTDIARGLSIWPLRMIGRLSYSWYLWHWPVFLVLDLRGNEVSPARIAAGILVSCALSVLTLYFVENPLRFGSVLGGRRRPFVLLAVLAAVAVAIVPSVAQFDPIVSDPFLARLDGIADDKVSLTVCTNVEPDEKCIFGEKGVTGGGVLVVGDSHAMHWLPAVSEAGLKTGLRVEFFGMSSCPAIPVATTKRKIRALSCERMHERLYERLRTLRPSVVIAASSAGYWDGLWGLSDDTARSNAWRDGVTQLAEHAVLVDAALFVLHDNPWWPKDPIDCVARSRNPLECSIARTEADAMASNTRVAEQDAIRRIRRPSVQGIDTFAWLCPGDTCHLEHGGELVMRDHHHLRKSVSPHFAQYFVEILSPFAPKSSRSVE